MTRRILHIAAYDIADPARLREGLRVLKDYAGGRQKSVFECFLSEGEKRALLDRMHALIDPEEDRFFLLRLDPRGKPRILQLERGERLFPLRRLSRIYVQQGVQWDIEALLACAERGINIVFFDHDGEVRARLLGRPGQRDELYHRMTEFLMLPQAEGMYRFWREELRRKAARWAGGKLRVPRGERDPESCRRWINQQARNHVGEEAAQRCHQWLRSLAYDWMENHLQDLGFGRQGELARSGEPALARDLTEILIWYLEPAYLGWLKKRRLAAERNRQPLRPPGFHGVVRLFESRAARTAGRGRDITSLLHRWLIHNG